MVKRLFELGKRNSISLRLPLGLFVLLLVISNTSVNSEVPGLIAIQGRLTDGAGNNRDGNFFLTFRIYDSQDPQIKGFIDALYTQGPISINVKNGIYQVYLGESQEESLKALFAANKYLFLGITVQGDATELVPRQRLVGVGYAFKAENSDTSDIAKGLIITRKRTDLMPDSFNGDGWHWIRAGGENEEYVALGFHNGGDEVKVENLLTAKNLRVWQEANFWQNVIMHQTVDFYGRIIPHPYVYNLVFDANISNMPSWQWKVTNDMQNPVVFIQEWSIFDYGFNVTPYRWITMTFSVKLRNDIANHDYTQYLSAGIECNGANQKIPFTFNNSIHEAYVSITSFTGASNTVNLKIENKDTQFEHYELNCKIIEY